MLKEKALITERGNYHLADAGTTFLHNHPSQKGRGQKIMSLHHTKKNFEKPMIPPLSDAGTTFLHNHPSQKGRGQKIMSLHHIKVKLRPFLSILAVFLIMPMVYSWWDGDYKQRYGLNISASELQIVKFDYSTTLCHEQAKSLRLIMDNVNYPFEFSEDTIDIIEFIYNQSAPTENYFYIYCNNSVADYGMTNIFLLKDNFNNASLTSKWVLDGPSTWSLKNGYLYGYGTGTSYQTFLNSTGVFFRGVNGFYMTTHQNVSNFASSETIGIAQGDFYGTSGRWAKFQTRMVNGQGHYSEGGNYTYPAGFDPSQSWAGEQYSACLNTNIGFFINGSNFNNAGMTVYANSTNCGAGNMQSSIPLSQNFAYANGFNIFFEALSATVHTNYDYIYAGNEPFDVKAGIFSGIIINPKEDYVAPQVPYIEIYYPLDYTHYQTEGDSMQILIDYTAFSTALDSCWYQNISETENISLVDCNNTEIYAPLGYWNLTIYANNSANAMNFSTVHFFIDNPSPPYNFTSNGLFSDNISNLSISHVMMLFFFLLIIIGLIIFAEYSNITIIGILVGIITLAFDLYVWYTLSWIFGIVLVFFSIVYIIYSALRK